MLTNKIKDTSEDVYQKGWASNGGIVSDQECPGFKYVSPLKCPKDLSTDDHNHQCEGIDRCVGN